MVERYRRGKSLSAWRYTCLNIHHKPHVADLGSNEDSAVRGWRLTAWAKVRPYILCVSNLPSTASHFLKEHCFWDGSQAAPVCPSCRTECGGGGGTAASSALRPQLLLCAALSFMHFVLPAWTTSRWRRVWAGEKPLRVEKPVQVPISTP